MKSQNISSPAEFTGLVHPLILTVPEWVCGLMAGSSSLLTPPSTCLSPSYVPFLTIIGGSNADLALVGARWRESLNERDRAQRHCR